MAEDPVSQARQIAAFNQRFPDDEHAKQEEHNIGVDRMEGNERGYLAGKQDGKRAREHYLPDLEPDVADFSDGDENEYCG